WNYVVGTYDSESSTATLYLNGVPVASQGSLSFAAPTSTNIILAGTGNTSAVFLDEVAFYNKALSYNDTPSENGMTGGYEAIASLLNDAAIGEKYDAQYVAPLNPGPDTRYVVFDTATGIWGQQASIQPTADPVATELADSNSPAWDVVSFIPASANGTVAPNGVTDIYLPFTLPNQATGQSITALSVSANGTTWSLFVGGQQLGLLQNGQLLNPLNPSANLDYVIKSPTVNLGLLIDPGTSGVTSQSQFTLNLTINGKTTSQTINPSDSSVITSTTTVSGTAVVTEANDSSLALIDSGFVINTTNNAMGYTLASADFNGDGLSDVAVGNSGYTNLAGTPLGQGSIQVLFGINDPVDGTAPAGVLNDNESSPLTTNNLSGNPGGLLITGIPDNGLANGNFPLSLATGDINGDGYADLIVGSPNANSFTGAVYCIFGGSTLAGMTIDVSGWTSDTSSPSGYMLTGNALGDGFGFAVAAGNFDGNNLADIAIGAPGVNKGQGAVYVALDGANPGAVYTSANSGELAGYAVAISSADASTSALSFTGNSSTDDLLIGAPGHVVNVTNHWTNLSSLPANTNQRNDYPSTSPAKAGAVYVFASTAPSSGTTATLATTFTSSPTQSYLGPNLPSSANGTASDIRAGSALASADWNGDGTNDLALSAPGGSNGDGSIYVINGMSSGGTAENSYLNTLSTLEIVGGLPGSATGTVITNAGDVNADGYQDLLITAPQGANGTGQSYVVFGPLMPDGQLDLNVTASDNKSTFLLNGSLPNQLTGTAAAAIGDINNDKVDDLMITAPNAAQIYAVYGHPWLADDGSIKLANLSGDNGFVVDGQLYQVPTADGMMPLSDNGLNVAVLGDVNGDGYADVLSGGDTAGQLIIFGNSTQDLLDAAAGTDDLLVTGSGYTALDDVMPMADINGDGYKDFGVIAGGSFGVVPGSPYLGAGGTLVVSPSTQVNGTAVTSASSAGDFNGDGYDDLLLTGSGGTDFYLGNSTATLSSPVSINTQGNTVFQGIGDVNGDGYDDIAGGNPDDNGQATIYYGNASALIGSTASPAPVILSPPTASTSGSLNNSDWTFYSSQASNQNPSWSGQETDIAPSFAVYNGYLYMLYNSNDNNHLWMQRSADGYTWEGLTDLGTGFETYEQASLGVFNDTLYLAFTGTNNKVLLSAATLSDDDLGVSFSTSGTFFQVGGQTADSGPTLVTYDGYLYVFFEAQQNKNAPIRYNWSSNPSDPSAWGSNAEVSQGHQYTNDRIGATVLPGSANEGAGTLLISYKANNNDDMWVGSFASDPATDNGSYWNCSMLSGQTTPDGPSMTTVGDTAYLFFRGDGDNTVNYMSSTNGSDWTDFNRIPNQTTYDRPSPVFFGESLYVSFAGTSKSSINMEISNPLFDPNQSQAFGEQFQNIGDFNGDGVADFAVLAPGYVANIGYLDYGSNDLLENNQGAVLIYFGSTSGINVTASPDLVLAAPAATSTSNASYTISNFSASGDLNGDGYDDLVLASPSTSLTTAETKDGIVAVVFGGSSAIWGQYEGVLQPFSLSTLSQGSASNLGFTIQGLPNSQAGIALGGSGDVNGDSFSDFMVGAPGNDDSLTYTIFGSDFTGTVNQTGTIGNDVMLGSPTGESFLAGQGDDRIDTNGGIDIVYAGPGDDVVTVTDTYFRRLDGGTGNDTLLLTGYYGQDWDLTTLSPGLRLRNFEVLSTENYGANTLSLNSTAVTALSSNNTLTLLMDPEDSLSLSSDFSQTGTVYQYNQNFTAYTSSVSAATVLVNQKSLSSTGNAPALLQAGGNPQMTVFSSSPATAPVLAANPTVLSHASTPTSLSVSSPTAPEAGGKVTFTVSRIG
ncbi:MAG: hypothetical protein RIQ52_1634, partial [Pseudomonadota bacterium]